MNPYTVLGLPPNASKEDARLAFRTLALKYHPDRNPNDPEASRKFKDISAAFDMIEKMEDTRTETLDVFEEMFKKAYSKRKKAT